MQLETQATQSDEEVDGFTPSTNRVRDRITYCKRRLAVSIASAWRTLSPTRTGSGFGILMYHRITPLPPGLTPPTWNVTPKQFRKQILGLIKIGYEPKPLSRVLAMHQEGRAIPANWFVITFDDIYENVYTNAWPILRDNRIPATMFVATAYLDTVTPFPFDDWPHRGQLGVPATHWQPVKEFQCREMLASGLIELGGHTHTHQDFRGRTQVLYEDLVRCRRQMRDRFGIESPTFAFPYGTKHLGFSGPEFAEAARRAGFACSLTTEDEPIWPESDPFDWGRFTAEPYDTPRSLAAKLGGYFTQAKQAWQFLQFLQSPRATLRKSRRGS